VLFRLLRGAGSAGLAGIRPYTSAGVIRPLLQVTRPEVEQYLTEHALPWRQDATNAELRFDRNRIRHQLLPALEADWNPEIQEILAQTADWAWEEEQYWQAQIAQLTAGDWVRSAKGEAVLDATRLNGLPVAVARRLIREVIRQVKQDLLGVSFSHIDRIRELAVAPQGHGRRQIAGIQVFRSYNWLRFVKSAPPPAGPDWQFPLTVPGSYPLPCGTVSLALERIRNEGVYNGSLDALDGDRACGPLVLRNWRAGDRYRRQGHAGVEKLKELFEDRRIPSWERRNWPIISIGNAVVWASGFGPAAEFAVTPDSRTVLTIRETRAGVEKV
jgi:tRNA(Ile)-lysidine synthase